MCRQPPKPQREAQFQFGVNLICEKHNIDFDLVERAKIELNYLSLTDQKFCGNPSGSFMIRKHDILKDFMLGKTRLTPSLEQLFNFWFSLMNDKHLPFYVTDIRKLLDSKGIVNMRYPSF